MNTYHLEEEHAIRDTLAKGECVSPDYVRPPKKEAQADVGEVKEDDEEEKVDETNAASVAEVVPLSTTNHETEEEKTSTKCISTHTLCLLIT